MATHLRDTSSHDQPPAVPQPSAAATAAPAFRFPTVDPTQAHVRALLENAMRYLASENRICEAASGFPVEGWNDEPNRGLFLRSFTQLTAIGQWMEILANVIAGYADTPYLSREQALSQLTLITKTLRADQQNPSISAKGLLGNFLGLCCGQRQGALTCEVTRQTFWDVFGQQKGQAIWQALKDKVWIIPGNDDRQATVQRGGHYGAAYFDGPLAPFADDVLRQKIMAILDRRVVMVVFGDNANLTVSVAKTTGALLLPQVKDRPAVVALRQEMEQFLDQQHDGYAHLYDPKAGLFNFGWNATANRMLGWEDEHGCWQTGHMDYLVNEFRAPTSFVVLRHSLPLEAVGNLGFKIKPYRMQDGREVFALAPWEGSAFQALGLGVSMLELLDPSWRQLLENTVDIELDYAYRHHLPGFLSESYTGDGIRYTGDVGIPDISVNPLPRITDAASLYTLGVAHTIAPAKIEQFLAANWPIISRLLTDHGPWEGFNIRKQEVIQIQTTAHTLSLILGVLGTASDNMQRYLDFKGLAHRLAELYERGKPFDFLAAPTNVFAWGDPGRLTSARQKEGFSIKGDQVRRIGIAFVPPHAEGVNLSKGTLSLRYRSAQAMEPAVFAFKPVQKAEDHKCWIPREAWVSLAATHGDEAEIQLPLPATPGLARIKEVVITYGQEREPWPVDLAITRLAFTPAEP